MVQLLVSDLDQAFTLGEAMTYAAQNEDVSFTIDRYSKDAKNGIQFYWDFESNRFVSQSEENEPRNASLNSYVNDIFVYYKGPYEKFSKLQNDKLQSFQELERFFLSPKQSEILSEMNSLLGAFKQYKRLCFELHKEDKISTLYKNISDALKYIK